MNSLTEILIDLMNRLYYENHIKPAESTRCGCANNPYIGVKYTRGYVVQIVMCIDRG